MTPKHQSLRARREARHATLQCACCAGAPHAATPGGPPAQKPSQRRTAALLRLPTTPERPAGSDDTR